MKIPVYERLRVFSTNTHATRYHLKAYVSIIIA